MELTPVTCNHCGAALQVPDSARFVTCRYCNSQLEIKRTDSSITTEVLAHLEQTTAHMADNLSVIRRDSEVERLDREWNDRRAQLLVKNKDGSTSTPSASLVGAVIIGAFGILWTIFTFALTAPTPAPRMPSIPNMPNLPFHDPSFPSIPDATFSNSGPPAIIHLIFPLFGVLFVIVAIAIGIKSANAANTYQEEERQYQQRRNQLLAQSPPPPAPPPRKNSPPPPTPPRLSQSVIRHSSFVIIPPRSLHHLLQQPQRIADLARRMIVPRLLRRRDAPLVHCLRLRQVPLLLHGLPPHEIRRHILRIPPDQLLKLPDRLVISPLLHISHRHSIAQKPILRLGLQQFPQLFQTRHKPLPRKTTNTRQIIPSPPPPPLPPPPPRILN